MHPFDLEQILFFFCMDLEMPKVSLLCMNIPYFFLVHAFAVYDVTKRDTFTRLENWLNELETYTTRNDIVKMLVGNKIDKVRFLRRGHFMDHLSKTWTLLLSCCQVCSTKVLSFCWPCGPRMQRMTSNWFSGWPWGGQKWRAEICEETLDAFYW